MTARSPTSAPARPDGMPDGEAGARALRIVIVSQGAETGAAGDDGDADTEAMQERDRALRIGLLEAGYRIVAVLPADAWLAERVRQLRPDVLIVDARSEARDAVEHVVFATRDDPRPIVMFTEVDDPALARQAVADGVTAYIVQGLQPHRVQSILEVALARFEREQGLRAELAAAKTQLSERRVVERAKGLLMKRHGIDEEEAYRRLRRQAMDRGLKLADLAQRLIDAADLLA